jgi:hypothetical protein
MCGVKFVIQEASGTRWGFLVGGVWSSILSFEALWNTFGFSALPRDLWLLLLLTRRYGCLVQDGHVEEIEFFEDNWYDGRAFAQVDLGTNRQVYLEVNWRML